MDMREMKLCIELIAIGNGIGRDHFLQSVLIIVLVNLTFYILHDIGKGDCFCCSEL